MNNSEKNPDRTSEGRPAEELSLGQLAHVTEMGVAMARYDVKILYRRLRERGALNHLEMLLRAHEKLRSAADDIAAAVTGAFGELANAEIDKIPEYPKHNGGT